MTTATRGLIDELRGAKDADFDGRYIAQQIDAHKEALILMNGYAKDGDVAAIKKFAAKTAPAVQSHLNMAEHLAKETSQVGPISRIPTLRDRVEKFGLLSVIPGERFSEGRGPSAPLVASVRLSTGKFPRYASAGVDLSAWICG